MAKVDIFILLTQGAVVFRSVSNFHVFYDMRGINMYMYHTSPKYFDTLTSYYTYSKIRTCQFHHLFLHLQTAGGVTNSVDRDQTPHSAASDL